MGRKGNGMEGKAKPQYSSKLRALALRNRGLRIGRYEGSSMLSIFKLKHFWLKIGARLRAALGPAAETRMSRSSSQRQGSRWADVESEAGALIWMADGSMKFSTKKRTAVFDEPVHLKFRRMNLGGGALETAEADGGSEELRKKFAVNRELFDKYSSEQQLEIFEILQECYPEIIGPITWNTLIPLEQRNGTTKMSPALLAHETLLAAHQFQTGENAYAELYPGGPASAEALRRRTAARSGSGRGSGAASSDEAASVHHEEVEGGGAASSDEEADEIMSGSGAASSDEEADEIMRKWKAAFK